MEKKDQNNWRERLKNTYRLTVANDDTLEEFASYRLTLLNVYVMLSTIVVVTAAIVLSLIIFTPLKKYIPGYANFSASSEAIRMNRQIDEMEKQLIAQKVYTDNFKKILTGDVEPPGEEKIVSEEFHDSLLHIERIEEDEQLRREVQLEEIREMSQNDNGTSSRIVQPRLEQIHFTAPLKGEISTHFKPEKKHFGVDVSAPKNTAVKAVLDGVVISSDWTLETGNTIGIQHANNLISFYKHNSKLLKANGDLVKAGEAIAIIGNTGTLSNGPHLHFEIWFKGKPVNPRDYILF